MKTNLIASAQEELRGAVQRAAQTAMKKGALPEAELPDFAIEIPKDKSHGDFAANFAMQWARALRQAPRKIAELVTAELQGESAWLEKVEIAGPGFVNFFLAPGWYGDVVQAVLRERENYGRNDTGDGRKLMVEFVSANPTGPMHMGNARGGVLGDSLASLFQWCGYDVTREFYVNDAGNQVALLGVSLEVRYLQKLKGEDAAVFPEDGYHGDDVKELAARYIELHGGSLLDAPEAERREKLVRFALQNNIQRMKDDLARYRITYDQWFLESSLHESGYVAETIQKLVDGGYTYEKEGALWFEATRFGAEKDEVMRKSNGFYTYYAVDLAYHRNKFEKRGFHRVVDVMGADHHGHKVRFKAGLQALGIPSDGLEIVLMQLVNLVRDGEAVRMSKRTGKVITLSNLLDEINVDAARFFFNSRQPDTHLDFDLSLAVRQDSENPVYYVQYAHARICSILKLLESEGVPLPETADFTLLSMPEERELIRFLAYFPNEILQAAAAYDPARMTRYCVELATLFHKFYNNCRVKTDDVPLMHARMLLCDATRAVIRNALSILNITAPNQM